MKHHDYLPGQRGPSCRICGAAPSDSVHRTVVPTDDDTPIAAHVYVQIWSFKYRHVHPGGSEICREEIGAESFEKALSIVRQPYEEDDEIHFVLLKAECLSEKCEIVE